MDLSEAHRDHFLAVELPVEQMAMLTEEAARSLDQQRDIEASDSISFDEYLRRYFRADAGPAREPARLNGWARFDSQHRNGVRVACTGTTAA